MSKLKSFLAITLLLSSFASTSLPAQAEKVLEGTVCSMNVHKLTSGIDWYTDLKKAEKAAAEQNKLVFWMHMLGKIDGAT
jgi:hypothetical protein